MLKLDLRQAEEAINRLVKVSLNDNQFAALVSFVFNIGEKQFKASTLLKRLNKGDYASVPAELSKWVNDNGKRIACLVNRRNAEGGLWVKGSFVSSASVPAEPAKAKAVTPELLTAGGAVVGTILTAGSGPGPLAFALAALIVIGGVVAAFYFIRKQLQASK